MRAQLNWRWMALAAAAGFCLSSATAAGPAAATGTAAGTATASSTASAVGGEYRLAAGDVVRVTVYQNPDLSVEVRVGESGRVSFPLLGGVDVGGLTLTQAEQRIADGLKTGNFVKQPQVSLLVLQVRGHQVSVLGQVGRPGRYPLETANVKVSEIVATAGGIAATGSDVVVVQGVRNGKPFRAEVDLPALFSQNTLDGDVTVQNGDVVWVDRAPMVYIYGEVQRPGPVRLERKMSLMQILATAGGVSQRGTLRGLQVHRKDADGKVRVIEPTMADVLKQDDVVYIRESVF